jgi:prepilin-type processing-associated H-X9-DG protein
MSALITLTCLILTGPVAADQAGKRQQVASGGESQLQAQPSRVLALAPADALFIIYLEKPADLLQHSLLGALRPPAEMLQLFEGAAETFSGPTMLAFCGSPLNPASIRLEVAIQPAADSTDFFARLEEKLLPRFVWPNAVGSVELSGPVRIVRIPGTVPLALYMAEKDGLVFGSGHYATVDAWLKGEALPERFVAAEDYARLNEDAAAEGRKERPRRDALVYFNARGLLPVAEMEFDRSTMPGLYSTLGLDRFESAAVSVQWSDERLGARVTIAVTDGDHGLPQLLASTNAAVQITRLLPADYTAFVRGALSNAAELSDVINRVLDGVDPDIVEEYAQECGEFRRDVGFDPKADFLANIVDEWVVGVRAGLEGQPSLVVALGLADPSLFDVHFSALTRAFGLEYAQVVYRDAVIRTTPPTASLRFSMGKIDRYVIFAREAQHVREVVDAWTDERTVASDRAFGSVARQLPAETAYFAFLNIAQLCRLGAAEARKSDEDFAELAEMSEALEKLSASEAGLGLAITSRPGAIDIDVQLAGDVDREARALLIKSVSISLEQSRTQARRVASMSNIRGIITACLIHAGDNKGAWPEAMSLLVRDGSCLIEQFQSPLYEQPVMLTVDNLDRESYYLYRPGTGLPPTEVVVCERELRYGGANFGFVDGHVEWLEGPRAAELLVMMNREAR